MYILLFLILINDPLAIRVSVWCDVCVFVCVRARFYRSSLNVFTSVRTLQRYRLDVSLNLPCVVRERWNDTHSMNSPTVVHIRKSMPRNEQKKGKNDNNNVNFESHPTFTSKFNIQQQCEQGQ